jgi:mRNA interferase YafQ
MLRVITTRKFEKDYRRCQRRGKDMSKILAVMRKLIHERPLEQKHNDHPLTGIFKDSRDCHVEPDWLLIYRAGRGSIVFERTGTHADLFK